jgi:hypothetical protein
MLVQCTVIIQLSVLGTETIRHTYIIIQESIFKKFHFTLFFANLILFLFMFTNFTVGFFKGGLKNVNTYGFDLLFEQMQ